MQRKAFIGTVSGVAGVLAVGIIVWNWASPSEAGQAAKPGESVIAYDDASYAAEHGAVQFSHPGHKEAYKQEKLDCKPCHMPPNAALFAMKPLKPGETRPVKKMEDMAKGQACGKCHDGATKVNDKVVFGVTDKEGCGNCHKKKS